MPSARLKDAPVGQTSTQGGSAQCWHRTGTCFTTPLFGSCTLTLRIHWASVAGRPAPSSPFSVAQAVTPTLVQVQVEVEKAEGQARETFDKVLSFNQQNYAAVVAAGDIYLKGIEAFNAALIATAEKTVAAGLANTQAVLSAANLQAAVELQSGFARRAFDDAVAETAKLSELTTKVANDAAKPITARVQETVETFVKAAA